MEEIMFSPLDTDLMRCVNFSFNDDNLVEQDLDFAVTFISVDDDDTFEGQNMINITVIDDEGRTCMQGTFKYFLLSMHNIIQW